MNMLKWKNYKIVFVTMNKSYDTNYNYILKPILDKLENLYLLKCLSVKINSNIYYRDENNE